MSLLTGAAIKKHKTIEIQPTIILIIDTSITICCASLLSLGNTTACSYLNVKRINKMAIAPKNKLYKAKSDLSYKRDITGDKNIGIACAMIVPPIKTDIFLKKSDFIYLPIIAD